MSQETILVTGAAGGVGSIAQTTIAGRARRVCGSHRDRFPRFILPKATVAMGIAGDTTNSLTRLLSGSVQRKAGSGRSDPIVKA